MMTNFSLQQSLCKKGIPMFFLILCSFFISENAFSYEHWNRNYITVAYNKTDNSIGIMCQIFDYAIGPLGEYAYLEYADFKFTTDGMHYEKLMRWEVVDSKKSTYAEVLIKDTKDMVSKKKFDIWYRKYPASGSLLWSTRNDSIFVIFAHNLTRPHLPIKYYLSSDEKITAILVTGKWHVKGLHCSDYFNREVYTIEGVTKFNPEVKTDTKQQFVSTPGIDHIKKNAVRVLSEDDAIVIGGVERGDQIKVYTTSGSLINRTIANNYRVKIKLPANHTYIVKLGQNSYKVAL